MVQVSSLLIPSIGVALTVFSSGAGLWDARQWDMLEKNAQQVMQHGAYKYPYHDFIAAHSSPPAGYTGTHGASFAQLPEIRNNALIIHNRTRYRVRETLVVSPEEVHLFNEHKNSLVLITCYPVGTTKERFVVVADTY